MLCNLLKLLGPASVAHQSLGHHPQAVSYFHQLTKTVPHSSLIRFLHKDGFNHSKSPEPTKVLLSSGIVMAAVVSVAAYGLVAFQISLVAR